jgi:undecaprenyl-diphosphatase
MTILHAFLLSLIEGITEFLPISSTGHLILASNLLGISQTEFVKFFELFIQLGAILAVITLYGKRLFVDPLLLGKIFVSFVPTAIIGLLFYPLIKNVFLESTTIVSWSLIAGGIVLLFIDSYLSKKENSTSLTTLSYTQAFFIGLIQSVSLIPGVSRSGATIVGALLLGATRSTAIEYSFLLAVPTMMAAVGLDIVSSIQHFTSFEYILLTIGFLGAYITALVAIKTFLQIVQKYSFIPFGIYRIIVGILFLFK